MMNKMEMVNNKRELKKQLDKLIEKYPQYNLTVYTWLNDCWSEENGFYSGYEVMIFFSSNVRDERSKCGAWIGNEMLVWKQVKIADGTNKYEEDRLMYQCYKATIELCNWARARYGEDRVGYPQILKEGVDEWLIYD